MSLSQTLTPSPVQSDEREALPTRSAAAPRRVLIVAPSLDILGGQAIQASRLLQRLGEEETLSVDLLPVNPRLPGPLRGLQAIKFVRTLVTFPYYVTLLAMRVPRYDVIHIFSASYMSFVLAPTPAILAGRLFGRRTILNYRSGEADDHLARWRSARATISLVDDVIVPSGYLVDVFRRYGFEARSIANFVDPGKFNFRVRNPLRPVFLSNRNHEPLYNVPCIIDAFTIIQSERPDAALIVTGDGSERDMIEARVRERNLANVTFHGKVEPARMAAVYDSADIYLNSPNIDNMPTSVIEAFACGLPVVTSNAGGVPYIVEHERTGLIFPMGDHATMANHALRLLRDPVLAQSIISNARSECEKYQWSAVRKEWLSLYHE